MIHEKWEQVHYDEITLDTTCRMVVPGGWLYRVHTMNKIRLCFVPDPQTATVMVVATP